MIGLAEFAPDRSKFDPSATDTLLNMTPRANGWGPFPSYAAYTSALPDRPQGCFLANLSQGDFQLFAATASKLYRLNPATLTWIDISKPATTYSTPENRRWSFAQYGSLVLATNGVDPIQSYDTGAPSTFIDLAATAPLAVNVSVVGDFVFATNTSDGDRVARWSGLNDPTFWLRGQNMADSQTFPDGGAIQAVAAFSQGSLIFQEDCINEASLAVNTPLIMTFTKAVENHGALAPQSVVSSAVGVFYLSQDGFYRYGAPPMNIGAERVNDFFFNDVALNEITEVVGTEDPYRSVIYWAYATNDSAQNHAFNRILAYHYTLDKWSLVEAGTFLSGLVEGATPGYTLDNLDTLGYTLDDLPYSLDSRVWSGGAPTLGAFDAARRFGFFSGEPLPARAQTAKVALSEGRRSYVSGFRAIGDAGSVRGRVGRAARASDATAWGVLALQNRTGLIPTRSDGRYHQFEINVPSQEWTVLHGLEPEARPAGLQ